MTYFQELPEKQTDNEVVAMIVTGEEEGKDNINVVVKSVLRKTVMEGMEIFFRLHPDVDRDMLEELFYRELNWFTGHAEDFLKLDDDSERQAWCFDHPNGWIVEAEEVAA